LIGIFDSERIMTLMENFLLGKVQLSKLSSNSIDFKSIKCEELQEKVSETSDNDEILKEIIEEEKKKRPEFEKERAKTKNTKKRRKKKKKDL